MIHSNGIRGDTGVNVNKIHDGGDGQNLDNGPNIQNLDIFNKLVFTKTLQKQSQTIKLNWKPLKQVSNLLNNNNQISYLLNKLAHSQSLKNRQIFCAQYKQPIVSQTQECSLIIAQKIQIHDTEVNNHIALHHALQSRNDDQTHEHYIETAKNMNTLIYKWRVFISKMSLQYQKQSFPIVAIFQTTSSRLNLNLQPKTTIYQQLILYRIQDIRHLTHLQGLYVLQQALIGFKMLYDIFGYFYVDEPMVGFNCEGKLKVWISPYFWTNMCYSTIDQTRNSEYFIPIDLRLSKEQQKQNEQQDMVTRIWMIVQKYSLFNQSIVFLTQGFRKRNFSQALALIVQHKSSIIDKRNQQLFGPVKFVDRLEFQSEAKDNILKTFETSKMDIFIEKLFFDRNKSTKDQINSNIKQKISQNGKKIDQKPYLFRHQVSTSKAQRNCQSHIKLIQENNRQNQKTQKISSTKKQRPQIFDRGYNHTMSNNMDQTNSVENSKNAIKSNYVSRENLFGNMPNISEHVRFINIRSIK